MNLLWKPSGTQTPFPCVFLSASIPKLGRDLSFLSGPAEPRLMVRVIETRVRDAISSLVAQVLRVGGRIVFGGHPAITPMVAASVSSFSVERDELQRPIVIYQSEYFRDAAIPAGRKEMEAAGLARTVWVPVDRLEAAKKFPNASWLEDKDRFVSLREGQADMKAEAKVVDALVILRVVICMDAQPDAVVCAGGMEGIAAEVLLYQKWIKDSVGSGLEPRKLLHDPLWGDHHSRLFALRSTFGAAAKLDVPGMSFIDELYVEHGHDKSLTFADLFPTEEKNRIEKQLCRRICFDDLMGRLVQGVIARGPVSVPLRETT